MAGKTVKSSAKKPAAKKAVKKESAAKPRAKKVMAAGGETDLIRRITWDRVPSKFVMPELQTGDTVGVYVKVKEGEKERVQLFEGIVIKIQGSGIGGSFTVRKIASGVGVERIFPNKSPILDRVEVISRGKVRRGRLFFLRGLKGRSARLETSVYFGKGAAVGAADEVTDAAPEADDTTPKT